MIMTGHSKTMRMKYCYTILFAFSLQAGIAQQENIFEPGHVWNDMNGNPINAHGGGILFHNDTYYWYGEIKKGKTWLAPGQDGDNYRVPAKGISCYSSKDLLHWKYEGIALSATTGDPAYDLDSSKTIERPKVIYNDKTGKFVMWMHVDTREYSYSQAGVAVSDRPQGPFHYQGSVKPNGAMVGDMTLFLDDDGKAYQFFSSEHNATMHVVLLSDDYTSHTNIEKRIMIKEYRAAPAVFKYNQKYYLISSGSTGRAANAALYAVSDSLFGDWRLYDSPCVGPGADSTFQSQSTYVLPVQGKQAAFIFLADRWNKRNLEDSRYVWLPLIVTDKKPQIRWLDQWDMSFFK